MKIQDLVIKEMEVSGYLSIRTRVLSRGGVTVGKRVWHAI